MSKHVIGLNGFTLQGACDMLNAGGTISLAKDARAKVVASHAYLKKRLAGSEEAIYGVNTGFGSLCDTVISKDRIEELQRNLVMSHACGAGAMIDPRIAKAMLLLKVQNLALGHSAIAPATLDLLIELYNNNIIPVIYERGSLGASGDLAPLAHMALPLLGLGEVTMGGKRMTAKSALTKVGLKPVVLGPKEGLALLNGTQFMSAHAMLALERVVHLSDACDVIAALSMDAYDARIEPFNALIHQVRPHPGQLHVAKRIRELREGSGILEKKKEHVQDPYSFRCVPQVHGASRDVITFVKEVVAREIASVTDNPTIFHDEDEIISGGNFHGQPLALALDMLAIAVAELGSISERRTYKLISGTRGLPAFLVAEPGINSGFMIPQYTAASLVSANKQRCMPSSVDTIDSSNGQEDHVSMGANAAIKCMQVVEDVERILGIELFNACQAIEFRRPLRASKQMEAVHEAFRRIVPFIEKDQIMQPHMEKAWQFVKNAKLL